MSRYDFFVKKTLFLTSSCSQIFSREIIVTRMSFKAKLKGVFRSHIVAMVTYCATKLTATCSPMIGQFVETMTVALTDKEWL